jgi:hypothetical protein
MPVPDILFLILFLSNRESAHELFNLKTEVILVNDVIQVL